VAQAYDGSAASSTMTAMFEIEYDCVWDEFKTVALS